MAKQNSEKMFHCRICWSKHLVNSRAGRRHSIFLKQLDDAENAIKQIKANEISFTVACIVKVTGDILSEGDFDIKLDEIRNDFYSWVHTFSVSSAIFSIEHFGDNTLVIIGPEGWGESVAKWAIDKGHEVQFGRLAVFRTEKVK